jgi:hypothetical protein
MLGIHRTQPQEVAHGGGLAAWLLEKLRRSRRPEPRLAVIERITLAPRQSLALVEAEGRRFLVATSAEGAPTFYALDEDPKSVPSRRASLRPVPNPAVRPVPVRPAPVRSIQERAARISW